MYARARKAPAPPSTLQRPRRRYSATGRCRETRTGAERRGKAPGNRDPWLESECRDLGGESVCMRRRTLPQATEPPSRHLSRLPAASCPDYRESEVEISVLTSVISLWIGHFCAIRKSSSRWDAVRLPVNDNSVLRR